MHGPRVGPHSQTKERVKRTRESPKVKSKGTKCAKGSHKGKTSKIGLSGLGNSKYQRQAHKLRNRDMSCTTDTSRIRWLEWSPDEWITMAGVLMNGMMTGVLLDDTKVGNIRMTLLPFHFHLEVWILVPPVVRSGLNG